MIFWDLIVRYMDYCFGNCVVLLIVWFFYLLMVYIWIIEVIINYYDSLGDCFFVYFNLKIGVLSIVCVSMLI